MTNKKFETPANKYSAEIYAKTKKYQKIYGFEIGTGKLDTWNNEADAFKHTFAAAHLSLKTNKTLTEIFGNNHETDGRKNQGQSPGEENMDKWNNSVGFEIAKEIRKESLHKLIKQSELDDKIAEKVMQRMRNGDLITHPDDPRKYKTPTEKFNDEIREKWRSLQQNRNARIQNRTNNSKKSSASGTTDGKWITINGNHVLIDK